MTHYDDGGNVRVDFVWGNMAMQPDDVRYDALDENLDSHEIAVYGWSNFPGYIPNYPGDGDSGLEAVVPDLVRLTISEAETAVEAVNLNLRANEHYLEINYLESRGTTVRVWCYDDNVYGGGYAQAYLIGLRVGDKLQIEDYSEYIPFLQEVTVTAVNEDGTDSWFTFDAGTEFNFDTNTDGYVYAGANLTDVITVMRGWNQPGDIRDEYTNIYCRYIGSY